MVSTRRQVLDAPLQSRKPRIWVQKIVLTVRTEKLYEKYLDTSIILHFTTFLRPFRTKWSVRLAGFTTFFFVLLWCFIQIGTYFKNELRNVLKRVFAFVAVLVIRFIFHSKPALRNSTNLIQKLTLIWQVITLWEFNFLLVRALI